MGRVEGKVAYITGAARGQGRSHAIRLAEEGADIVAVDICAPVATAPYAGSTLADLEETARQVEALGRGAVARRVDVRDRDAVRDSFAEGVAEFGHVDFVAVNHGITSVAEAVDLTPETWQDMIDINLTGVFNVCQAAMPHLIARQEGAIAITSSLVGLRGFANVSHYISAKHGVVGLMRALAHELGPHGVRINTIHPSQVDTPMLMNQAMYDIFRPDLEHPGAADFLEASREMHLLPIQVLQPRDVSNVLLFLFSDEGRVITGVTLPVDAGAAAK